MVSCLNIREIQLPQLSNGNNSIYSAGALYGLNNTREITQGSAWHTVGTQPVLLFPLPHPAPPGKNLGAGTGSDWYSKAGTPSFPESPPPPGRSRPRICCPRCIPIRRISQPGGSGYRRLNDKVPPLPAWPASRPAGTRSGFSTLAAAQEETRTAVVRSASS